MNNSIQELFTEVKLADNASEETLKKLIDNELASTEEIEEYKKGEALLIFSEAYINNLDMHDDIDPNWADFNASAYTDYVSNLLSGRHFLVVAKGCRWDGANGYGLYTEMEDALYRGYDVEQVIKEKSDKYFKLIESSHDVPMGHTSYVVSLTNTECDKVQNWLENREFEKIDEFVEKIVN